VKIDLNKTKQTFNVACVPTGINTGVCTVECGRIMFATRALLVEHSATISNVNAGDTN
jgi:hypothetical protein